MFRPRLLLTALGLVCSVIPSAALAQTRPEDKYFDSDHTRIRYVDVGSGEPIVLIHGFTGSTELSWLDTGILDTLSKEFRVIAMDLRGHGKSDKPHDPASYGVKMVADVARLLDHLRLQKAHIVGYSAGAGITLKFLTMYPERVVTATLGGYGRTGGWTAQREQGAVQLATSLEHGDISAVVLGTWPTDEPKPSEDVIERLSRELLSRNDALALAAVMRNAHEVAITDEQVKAVRSPVLAVCGTADRNLAGVTPLKTLLPALQVVKIEGASHPSWDTRRGALRRPEFVKAVRDFIAAHRSELEKNGS